MNESELKSVLSSEITTARSYENDLSSQREQALDYYYGRKFGNERDGFSKVVSRDVQDIVESALPKLMEMFLALGDIVEFIPRNSINPDQEELNIKKAKEQTAYANYIFFNKNDGFQIIQDCFKDGLLLKNGIAKVTWGRPEGIEITTTKEKLSEEQFLLLKEIIEEDPDREITAINKKTRTEEIEVPVIDPQTGQPLIDPQTGTPLIQSQKQSITEFDVKVLTKKKEQCIVESLPPEEFLINRDAKDIDSARFVSHEVRKTRSDLIAEGFDPKIINKLPEAMNIDVDIKSKRRQQANIDSDVIPSSNKAMQKVVVNESYIKIDLDEDDIAEHRMITTAGSGSKIEILSNEEIDYNPFVNFSPIKIPHSWEAISLAELVFDIQLNKSIMQRQLLDNTYLSNIPMKTVVEGQVNIDDLLSPRVGGIIRVKNQDAIRDMVVPNIAQTVLGSIEYWDTVKQERTGINDISRGMNAEKLQNTTATAIDQLKEGAEARMQLVARNYADSIKKLFKKIIHCSKRFATQKEIISLTGEFVEIDPNLFDLDLMMSVNVGLGNLRKETKFNALNSIKSDQMQLMQLGSPLIDDQKIFNTMDELTNIIGFEGTNRFFNNPQDQDQQIPQQALNQAMQQVQGEFDNQIKDRETTVKERDVAVKEQELALKSGKQAFDQDAEIEKIETGKQKDAINLEIKNKHADIKKEELDVQTALEVDKRLRGERIDANIPGEVRDLAKGS